MSDPGTLAAALAHLPAWWEETSDPAALDGLLAGWAGACGWRACGFVWPADGPPAVARTIRAGALADAPPPADTPDAARRLRAGEEFVAGANGRAFAAVPLAGRPGGLVWVERAAGAGWTADLRAYLALAARAMGRSPAVAAAAGSGPDPERLAQRLADAAVIAGRMAHDFNNILTGIVGFSDLLAPLVPPGTAANFVAEISKVGQRGIRFVGELHQFGRSGQPKPGAAGVRAAVAAEADRLKAEVAPEVGFDADLPPDLPAAAIEAGVLRLVLGHLMANAAEATPAGGRVRVAAREAELTDADARAYLGRASAGPHLLVAVTDAGPGIPPEVRRRVLAEPFYTTKVRHRGLGLAVAYRALAAHRGGLRVEPAPPPGTGTEVRVVLPTAATPRPATGGARPTTAGR
jgi:signal transduction histidine kinase